MMNEDQKNYLLSRGYDELSLKEEGVIVRGEGACFWEGMDLTLKTPSIIWTSKSMSGQLIGLQTRELEKKAYRWLQAPKAQHLPIIYGSPDDYRRLYETGDMVLTEGAFDRIVVKRSIPDIAVLARLSKGAGNQLTAFIKRYAKRIWLSFDNDEVGKKADKATEERLEESLDVYTLRFPAKDPSELFKAKGFNRTAEILRKQIEGNR